MKTLLIQLLRILLAYAISALITGFVVHGSLFLASSVEGTNDARNLTLGLFIALMISWLASFPAALAVTVGEWLRWRMWWYYSVCGSIIGLVLGYLFQPPAFFPYLGVSFGIVSGLIYWAIAGRRAGLEDGVQRKTVTLVMVVTTAVCFFFNFVGMFGTLFR
jgi:hypothetical protein